MTRLLTRFRVALGFLMAGLVLWLSQPRWSTWVAGAIVAGCGELLRIWAAGHIEKSREVTSSGPYRFTRHPLYMGSTLIGIGVAVASASVVVAAIIGVYLGLTLSAARRSEAGRILLARRPAIAPCGVHEEAAAPKRGMTIHDRARIRLSS